MENMILEQEEIAENQLSFDFLDGENSTKTLTEVDFTEKNFKNTLVIILNSKKMSPSFYLCGKKMVDWVRLATSGFKQEILDEHEDGDVFSLVKNYVDKAEYIAVFYSDTPLLQKTTFFEIMNFFTTNSMNFLRLPRGYVFDCQFLKSAKMLMSSGVKEFGENDFCIIDDAEKISFAFKILNGRILNYHKKNGVVLFGEETIFVDADVEIEAGSVIYPNNTIKGQSYIGKGVILESGNYIIDSIVCDGAFVCQSYIENSKVCAEKTVGPFARIIKGKV
jgi:bifunctional UDP-N-acetylglucosamine pyrophosphorylase/glucosamine-1-phosphate N-acetyltransferase